MSKRHGPSPRAMNGGSPPTAPNARAGLLTPPGISRLARANAAALRGRGTRDGGSEAMIGSAALGRLTDELAQLLLGLFRDLGKLADRVIPVELGEVACDLDRAESPRRVGGRRHVLDPGECMRQQRAAEFLFLFLTVDGLR